MFNPDKPECKYCENNVYRKGLCYEHYNNLREQHEEYLREQRWLKEREEKISYSSKDV